MKVGFVGTLCIHVYILICVEIAILARRSEAPPQGPIVLSITDARLESHWETAAGEGDSYPGKTVTTIATANEFLSWNCTKTYLPATGFTSVSLLGYKSLESSVNDYFDWIETQEDEELRINSEVVTVAVTNPDTAQLKKKVSLTLSHLKVLLCLKATPWRIYPNTAVGDQNKCQWLIVIWIAFFLEFSKPGLKDTVIHNEEKAEVQK